MKIQHYLLYGTLDPRYGGPTYSIPIQIIGTEHEGADMSFVVYEGSKPWEDSMHGNGVKMINLPDPKGLIERNLGPSLNKYFKKLDETPDILHFHGVWMPVNYKVAKYGWKHQIPYVINPRGDLETTRINYDLLKRIKKMAAWFLYSKRIVKRAACIFATSEQERDGIRRLRIMTPIAIIPNGIELNAFPKEVVHHHSDKRIVLFLSRINPIKGIEYLIDAWNNLGSELRNNWELHIAGNSDPKDYIETLMQKVNDLELSDSIKFIGTITGDAKLRKYQDTNLFVLPTLNENFGNVVAEALMCECPVITTKNAPWRCLEDYHCGWWIDLSVEQLSKTLADAMTLSDEERHEMGRKGRKCITELFAAPAVAKKTMAVYRWVLGKSSKPDFVELG